MQFSTLSAEYPLVKTFTLSNGVLEKSPYPNAYLFTNQNHEVESLKEFKAVLTTAAKKGHCLLKGKLSRDLNNESRARATESQGSTNWICFDLDGLSHLDTVEKFMVALGLNDVSYVVQYSASSGVDVNRGLSAHIFCQLSHEVAAPFLKQWLISLNLTVSDLRSELTLTRTGNSLHWPLDITTCQNDKLIYIADPILGPGVKDSFKGKRIAYVEKDLPTLPTNRIKADINKNRLEAKNILNELRKKAGCAIIKDNQYKTKNNIAYLAKPGDASVNGIKEEREFVYFNLNGGDSWAYYHPVNNPEFIFNFKGEPNYRTEELLPDYWASLKTQVTDDLSGVEYFVLRDFKTDRLFNGYYDTKKDEVVIARAANESRLRSFLKQHGQPVPDFIYDWDLVHDPESNVKYDPEKRVINLYTPSPYYKLKMREVHSCPSMIQRVIDHAVGSHEEAAHFVNWLAFIMQNRTSTGTAWTLHGNQGTGKGILFHKVIRPMLGLANTHFMLMGALDSQFNGFMETSLLTFIDEVQFSKLAHNEQINAALKSYISEPATAIRRMHTDTYVAKNHNNFIFASNMPDPVCIEVTDRRNNVGRFQPNRLEMSDADIEQLEKECEDFFMYLMHLQVDTKAVRTVLKSADRDLLISINRTSVDEVADALLDGNLEYLIDQLPSSDDPIFMTPAANAYRTLMEEILRTGEKSLKLSRDELFIIYDYCVGGTPRSPNKFTSMLKHHRLYTKKVRRGDKLFYGVNVPWKHDAEWFETKRKEMLKTVTPSKVVNIKHAKVLTEAK